MKHSTHGVVEKVTSEIRSKTTSVNFFLGEGNAGRGWDTKIKL